MLSPCARCGTSLDRATAEHCGVCDYTVCPSCRATTGPICPRCGGLVAGHIYVGIIDVVPAKRVDTILDATFGASLLADGFAQIRHRVWARARVPDITDVFNIQALKGASLSATWGFSITFVPHVSAGKVKWHRTLKSARLDVRYDPRNFPTRKESPDLQLDTLYGESELRDQGSALAALAIPQALRFWGGVNRVVDLRDVLEGLRQKDKDAVAFGFYNYIQHPLALAFTHARLGDRVAAFDELSRSAWFQNDPADLKAALIQALEAELAERGA